MNSIEIIIELPQLISSSSNDYRIHFQYYVKSLIQILKVQTDF